MRSQKTIELLIEAGANVNVQDDFGGTPLYLAIVRENLELVKILVENGADVNLKDSKGRSPLFYAAKRYKVADIVQYLQEHEAVE